MSRALLDKNLHAVKADLKARFGNVPGVLGFGIGKDSVRVYIHDESVETRLPKKFEGVDLDLVVTGDIATA